MDLPPFRWITQRLSHDHLRDIPTAVRQQLAAVLPSFLPGQQVAITAGSRGVTNIPIILRAACEAVRAAGGEPFLVPAMGTHGGATAAGQVELLASLGVTEESVGAPIRSSMDVVVVGRTPRGTEVYMDRIASEADAVLLVERIKPHTDFTGRYESGLCKMMAIGLGKAAGALRIHSLGSNGLRDEIPEVARVMLAARPIVAGLAIIENALGQTEQVVALRSHEILEREPALLEQVKRHMAGFPFPEADIVLLDWVGKDISGTAMDSKTVGRISIAGVADPERPRIGCLAALDLTDVSHGNATGIGLADVTTERLARKVDMQALRINSMASGFWQRAKMPMPLQSDAEVLQTAIRVSGRPASQMRICRARDTLHLERMVVSEPLLAQIDGDVEVGPPYQFAFDAEGNFADHKTFPD